MREIILIIHRNDCAHPIAVCKAHSRNGSPALKFIKEFPRLLKYRIASITRVVSSRNMGSSSAYAVTDKHSS